MNRLESIIKKHSTGGKVLILFILTNIIYAFMLLVTIPKVMSLSGGMKILDMMPGGYNPQGNEFIGWYENTGHDAWWLHSRICNEAF